MKRFINGCLVFIWCVTMLGASAQAIEPLPAAVSALCEATYPGRTVSAYAGWGNDQRGQFALVLSQGAEHMLCIAEKADTDTGYGFSVANEKALREGEELPSLLIDTGGDSLFFRYDDMQYSYSYHASKNEEGTWGAVDLIRYDTVNYNEMGFTVQDGLLQMDTYLTDQEGNIRAQYAYVPVPAAWLADTLTLDRFDISVFPTDPYEAMDNGGMQAAADLLLPEGVTILDGGVAPIALSLLVDKPDGTRRLFLCRWTAEGGWQVTESSPLPSNASIDTFHSWSSMIVEWVEGETQLGYSFLYTFDGRWLISYAMATDWFELREDYVKDPQEDQNHYGTFPEADLRTIDWKRLPRTFEQAVSMLDTAGWARVTSDDPANRLHLRVSPQKDAKSLGKYYSGTPVRVLGEQGDWAHVSVYGIEGWMMKAFLSFGEDMLGVHTSYPSLVVRDELNRDGVKLYEQPDENAAVTSVYHGDGRVTILGVVGEEWFHVLFNETGGAGYMKQEYFWPGNG